MLLNNVEKIKVKWNAYFGFGLKMVTEELFFSYKPEMYSSNIMTTNCMKQY
jgi:hypothetical protein